MRQDVVQKLKSGVQAKVQQDLPSVLQPGEQVFTVLPAFSRPSPHWHWLFQFFIVHMLRKAFVICLTNRRLMVFRTSKAIWGYGRLRAKVGEFELGGYAFTTEDRGSSVFLGPWTMLRLTSPSRPPLSLIIQTNLWLEEMSALMENRQSA